MKISLVKTELKGIEDRLDRLNSLIEQIMTHNGIQVDHSFTPTDDQIENWAEYNPASYTDEEAEMLREHLDRLGRKERGSK